jgi:hypothetical protein
MKHLSLKLLAIIVFSFLIIIGLNGCNSNSKEKTTEKTANDTPEASTPTIDEYIADYSPLTREKFTGIRKDFEPFSTIVITFTNDIETSEPEEVGRENKVQELIIYAGVPRGSISFSGIPSYKGFLEQRLESQPSKVARVFEDVDSKVTFSTDEVNLIFNFMDSYPDYFFGLETFKNLPIPFRSKKVHIGDAGYCFTLAIYEPNSTNKAWVVNRCMEQPDPVLEELIKLLQDNFIADFNSPVTQTETHQDNTST